LVLLPLAMVENALPAEPTVITLSCDGQMLAGVNAKPETVSKIGVVVNLAEQTVSFLGHVVTIDEVDTTRIHFSA
jgi:hypothetical protein